MAGVAALERAWSAIGVSPNLRPIVGGLIVGGLGLIAPEALGAGHGALGMNLVSTPGVAQVVLVQVALVLFIKGLSSAISLSSGFRGGLFFCSLLIGALAGRLYGEGLDALWPAASIDPAAASILGMAAVGAGVIGSPVAMTFFALETTSDFRVTVAALLTSALAGLIVRETFGYSFATWRFHLRGEAIRGPQDIGWMRDLKASRLMRKDFRAVAADRSIAAARVLFPIGATREIHCSTGTMPKSAWGSCLVSDLHAIDAGRLAETISAPAAGGGTISSPPRRRSAATIDAFDVESEAVTCCLSSPMLQSRSDRRHPQRSLRLEDLPARAGEAEPGVSRTVRRAPSPRRHRRAPPQSQARFAGRLRRGLTRPLVDGVLRPRPFADQSG